MSYIMTLHTTNILSFQDKDQYKDNYYQRSWFQIRFLYLSRVYLLTTNSRLDSCILPGHVWRVRRSDSCMLPGCICWRLSPDSIPVSCQGTSEEFEDPIPVFCQGVSIDDYFQIRFLYLARSRLKSLKIRFLYPARAYLLTTNSGQIGRASCRERV